MNMRSIAFVAFLFSASLYCHKTVFLISPPRSLSVAFLRMMEACRYFTILNEPFISAFAANIESERELTQGWWNENAPTEYCQAEACVIKHMQKGPVFIKEIAFAIDEYMQQDNPFIGNTDVYFIFLVRNPHHMLCSYYKGLGAIVEKFEYLAAYEQCYRLYMLVKDKHPNAPLIILSEDLYNDPEKTAQKVCNAVDIPYTKQMLHWQSLDSSFTGKEWHDLKNNGWIEKWHSDAMHSTGIGKPRSYEVDANGQPTFSEVTNDADRAVVWQTYKTNKIYYDLLVNECQK